MRKLETKVLTCSQHTFTSKQLFMMDVVLIAGITDYIKGGYLMRRAWKLYDKCYCEISAVGGPFLMWAPELRGEGNGALQDDMDEEEEALNEVVTCINLR